MTLLQYLYRNKIIMKKVVRLTEQDLVRLINRVINEQGATGSVNGIFKIGDILMGSGNAMRISPFKVTNVQSEKIEGVDRFGKKMVLIQQPGTNQFYSPTQEMIKYVIDRVNRSGQEYRLEKDGSKLVDVRSQIPER